MSQALAQSATKLASSLNGEEAFPFDSVCAQLAGISYEGEGKMRLEKVTLNRATLIQRMKTRFTSEFASIYEPGQRLPDAVYAKIESAVDKLTANTFARLSADGFEVQNYSRSFAWNSTHKAYGEKATVTANKVLVLPRQKLAAGIAKTDAENKLKDLRNKNIAENDIRIVNAIKRVEVATERLNAVVNEIKAQASLTEMPTA